MPMGRSPDTFPTTGLPLATYYVYVQSPGANGMFNIDLEDKGIYSGQVVNTGTNALIFNFTGTGSVQDAAASRALSDAINNQGVDDAYTKLTFQLVTSRDNSDSRGNLWCARIRQPQRPNPHSPLRSPVWHWS